MCATLAPTDATAAVHLEETRMPSTKQLIEKRKKIALSAIRKAFGTEEDEEGATLFVEHHLEEIGGDYWKKHLGTEKPEPERVLELLQLVSPTEDDGDDELDLFDFTLPEGVTDYLLSVCFDEDGEISEITMES